MVNPQNPPPEHDTDPLNAPPGELPTDAVVVRTLRGDDLDAIVRIDREATGTTRREYYESRVHTALTDSRLQTSLVAELDGQVAGFLITRLYYGEFGQTEPVAVIDSIGVHPGLRGRHVGQALLRQLVMNLRALGVERIETIVDWNQFDLLGFLAAHGFEPAPRICLRRLL